MAFCAPRCPLNGRQRKQSPNVSAKPNHRRSLTLKMIWRLHEGLGIPAESRIKVRQDRAACGGQTVLICR